MSTMLDAVCMADEQAEARRAIAALERQFGLMINRVRAQIRHRSAQIHPDLLPGTYKVLSTLVYAGPLHAGALANKLAVDKSMVSRSVKQLMELGLVTRQVDPADGRAWIIAASTDAVDRVQEVGRADQEMLHTRLLGWDVGDIERLAALLGRLNDTADGADDVVPVDDPDKAEQPDDSA